jgi:hypothetical protein
MCAIALKVAAVVAHYEECHYDMLKMLIDCADCYIISGIKTAIQNNWIAAVDHQGGDRGDDRMLCRNRYVVAVFPQYEKIKEDAVAVGENEDLPISSMRKDIAQWYRQVFIESNVSF